MSLLKKIEKVLKHPIGSIILIAGFEKFKFIPDKKYISILYGYFMNQKLDIENPKTFNEKLQWLKLYNRKPEYTMMVDKYLVRDYIANKIGADYLIPLIGVWDSPEEICFSELPNQFVLKCNHNSGTGMCICKDKSKADWESIKNGLYKGIKENYFYLGREWPYKNVPRKVIAEKFMVDESGCELKDYKVMCFNGEPKLIELHQGRFTDHQTQDYYDLEWNKTSISQGNLSLFGNSTANTPRPDSLEEMLHLSRILAEGIPQVRIDWYSINGKLYFGEITFFDGSGFDPYDDPSDDLLLGSWIQLPSKKRIE